MSGSTYIYFGLGIIGVSTIVFLLLQGLFIYQKRNIKSKYKQ